MRILVADDEEAIRRSVRRFLERAGHEVEECADGAEVVKRLRESLPDILLTDLHMPNLNGVELVRTLRRNSRGMKIIVFSGAGADELLEIAARLGADATLSKPFTSDQLHAVIQQVSGT